MHILSTAHSGEGSTCILPTDRANALQGKQIEIQALALKKIQVKTGFGTSFILFGYQSMKSVEDE